MQVIVTKKRIKNIIIKVRKPNLVEVSLPYFVSRAKLDEILKLRSNWIKQRFEELENIQTMKLLDDEFVYFLGKKYKLKIINETKKGVEINDDKIILKCPKDSDFSTRERILDDFYKAKSKEIFKSILDDFCKLVKKDIKSFKVRKMKTRWGSCNSTKSYINLNTELVKKDILAIEAVIMHELMHLYHADHSKAFYNKLLSFMPDYYERIKLLKSDKEF